jgi:lysyl-tRNA synthetase class 2
MFNTQLTKARLEKAERIKNAGMQPYGHITTKTVNYTDFSYFKERFDCIEDLSKYQEKENFTGRVMLLRKMGKSGFFHVQGENGERLQFFASLNELSENFKVFKNMLDIGDIVSIEGKPYRTKTGELTVYVTNMEILTKSISPFPEKFHGLEDEESRYRKRYLDMIMNPEVTSTFKARSIIVKTIRNLMDNANFLEVETPALNPIPGGANAKPFITHHNALNVDRYLRIAPELYLKRLLVGGMNKVYEIGKNFRNEGIDKTHNPEFTSMEFYAAYHNYEHLMTMIEGLINEAVLSVNDSLNIEFGDQQIDFNNWVKIPYKTALVEIGGAPEEILEDTTLIEEWLKEKGFEIQPGLNRGKLWEKIFDEFVESKIIDPVFITDYPIEISPLARRSDKNPEIAERFELFIAGREIANGFNELNDPIDQYERFKAQVADKENDDESMHMDKDFIEALMYGMPPAAGAGIGIDRLVMILTNSQSIKDVILFPAMK